MDVSFYIASRLRFKGRVAVVCIVVSFLVMIIAVAVSSGFRNEIRNCLTDISGDVLVTPVDMNYLSGTSPIERHPAYMSELLKVRGVQSVSPVVYRAGIVKNGENIHGVLFKGIEGGVGGGGSEKGSSIEDGEEVQNGGLKVSIPSRLSAMLSLEVGDDLTTYFVGERIRVRKFTVGSIYEPIVQTDDKLVVYADLADIQRVNGWSEEEVSAFEVFLAPRFRSAAKITELGEDCGFVTYMYSDDDEETVVCTAATRLYPQIYDWLNLIDFNVLFILVLMTLVAGFNMISGLLIMLFENISTIGLLKALGMTDRAIAKVFLATSSSVILRGMVLGNLIAFALCLVEHFTHLIKLNPVNYFVTFVPVHINIWAVLLADVAAYAVIMLLLLIPSLYISRIDPAKTVAVK
ncbi:MAG: FtsX-like permease family protein [Bacteroidales bacterium]|nr:FtsX-like permease family protein [Bacteroidales bacterium]